MKVIKYPPLLRRGEYNWGLVMKALNINSSSGGVTTFENMEWKQWVFILKVPLGLQKFPPLLRRGNYKQEYANE